MDDSAAAASYVVIGASAGGVAALSRIFRMLPSDFPGALLVVLHVGDKQPKSWLAERLVGIGNIPVKEAEDGEPVRQGMAYVAPAGRHLLLEDKRVRLGTGPPENRVRPSVDVLFRSAARAQGKRVIGLVLTGLMTDGTLGLRAIRDAGGVTIVQNPETAEFGEMPRSAKAGLGVDYSLELSEIAPLLDLLVRRAGRYKRGVLETGLASSVRLMKDRARLLAKLHRQSRNNPRTARFLDAEIAALDHDIAHIQRLIARSVMTLGNGGRPPDADRRAVGSEFRGRPRPKHSTSSR